MRITLKTCNRKAYQEIASLTITVSRCEFLINYPTITLRRLLRIGIMKFCINKTTRIIKITKWRFNPSVITSLKSLTIILKANFRIPKTKT